MTNLNVNIHYEMNVSLRSLIEIAKSRLINTISLDLHHD